MHNKNFLSGMLLILLTMLVLQVCTTPSTSGAPPLPAATPTNLPLPDGLVAIEDPSLTFIDFQDDRNGWGIAYDYDINRGTILRSQDGGASWLDVTPLECAIGIDAARLTMLNTSTTWVLVPGTDYNTGTLCHTLDGGATWTSNPVPFGGAALQFLDASTGRAMADRGVGAGSNPVEIFQTSDGGVTWTSVYRNDPVNPSPSETLPLSGVKNGMTFSDSSTGWVTGTRPVDGEVYLFRTQNGGATWAMQTLPLSPGHAASQFMPTAPLFFGQDGFLPLLIYSPGSDTGQSFFVTHDGGLTWGLGADDPSHILPPGEFSFVNALNGIYWNGGSTLYFTSDGAQSWSQRASSLDLSASLSMIDFVSSTTGWSLTSPLDNGQSWLYRSDDSGASWVQLVP